MLISPSEPKQLRDIGTTSSKPEKFGADILIPARDTLTGIQRKQFPDDFLSSLDDGRLYDQLPKMQALGRRLLLFEGSGRWTQDGELISNNWHKFNNDQLLSISFTIQFEFNVAIAWVKSLDETINLLTKLDSWCNKARHDSLRRRPGPGKSSWGTVDSDAWQSHLLQSFQGIGPGVADKIIEYFGRVPLGWELSGYEELMEVPGVGKKTAIKLWEALEGERRFK